jgi:hypothetical protein
VHEGSFHDHLVRAMVFSADIDESGRLVVVCKEMRDELELAPTVSPEEALRYSCTLYLSYRIPSESSGHMLTCVLPL